MSENPERALVEAGEGSSGGEVTRPIRQPGLPHDLPSLFRYAIEVGREDALVELALPEHLRTPLDPERAAFLDRAIHNMVVDLEDSIHTAIETLTNPEVISRLDGLDELTPEVAAQFESLGNLIDDIDIANGFCKMRGFDCFPLCYGTWNPALWAACNNLLAEVTQNNPPCQQTALDSGLLVTLMHMLRDPGTPHKDTFVYALSCCIREFGPGCVAVISDGGCEALAGTVTGTEPRARAKAAFLLRYLCHHYSEAKERMVALHLPRLIAPHIHTSEHLVALLGTYVENPTPEVLRQCRESNLGLMKRLQDIITSPAKVDDPEAHKDEIDNCNEILNIVFEGHNELLYDCEEEADR